MRALTKTLTGLLSVLALCAVASAAQGAAEGSKEAKQLEKATSVLNEIMQTPDKGIPSDLFEKAVCVGIVPSEIKGALGIGGTYGRGVLVCRKHGNGPWGAPSLFTLGGANIGFQLGGKATDVVFLVMNPGGVNKLLQDKVKLGAEVSATAGPVGRTAEGATDAQLHAEILSYSRTRGLFAGVSLEGQVLKQDADDNERLYGRRANPKAILISGVVKPPPAARPLDNALTKYAPHGGAPVPAA
jgi:SH3 domain-containing YSC84-like protein 1